MNENLILRRIAELSNNTIEFEDEKILCGTAWIGGMPIDISVDDNIVTLNSVGMFAGDAPKLSKGIWRGKGKFASMIPAIKQTLTEFNLLNELHIFPLSPVWKKNYHMVKTDDGHKIIL